MVRVTNAVAAKHSRKKLFKRAKGFVGDRKNHLRLTKDAVLSAEAFNYRHRKLKKREFRSLWVIRISAGAKIHGISYSKLIHGMALANCKINRKRLAEMAESDPQGFAVVANAAKLALC